MNVIYPIVYDYIRKVKLTRLMPLVTIATRCSNLSIESVLSSTLNRARQTAEIIGEHIDKKVQYSDLFIERRRPTEQIGLKRVNCSSLPTGFF